MSKPVPNIATFEALCNKLVGGSFDERRRDVNFKRLDEVRAQAVGLFGYNEDVWKVLWEHGAHPPTPRHALCWCHVTQCACMVCG